MFSFSDSSLVQRFPILHPTCIQISDGLRCSGVFAYSFSMQSIHYSSIKERRNKITQLYCYCEELLDYWLLSVMNSEKEKVQLAHDIN